VAAALAEPGGNGAPGGAAPVDDVNRRCRRRLAPLVALMARQSQSAAQIGEHLVAGAGLPAPAPPDRVVLDLRVTLSATKTGPGRPKMAGNSRAKSATSSKAWARG